MGCAVGLSLVELEPWVAGRIWWERWAVFPGTADNPCGRVLVGLVPVKFAPIERAEGWKAWCGPENTSLIASGPECGEEGKALAGAAIEKHFSDESLRQRFGESCLTNSLPLGAGAVLFSEGFEQVPWTGPNDKGAKHDDGKAPWNLVPWRELEQVVEVYRFGAAKYGPDSWQSVPNARERYFAALMRHVTAWRLGERNDPESGIHHLAHVAWGCLALMWFDRDGGAQ